MENEFILKLENQMRSFSSDPKNTRGRLYPEADHDFRNCFQRDRDRIVHTRAFRRLEYKTQVFVNHEGDHYRTRLTHTLEVAQIARAISRAIGVSEDLAEAIALAHDLGHPPFGHAGEDALNDAMQPFGGFDHNAHSIKIITNLEHCYAKFDGLNLSWETLEGICKHNGPLTGSYAKVKPLPEALAEYNNRHDLELDKFAGLEAQIASLADDIAYCNHDIEDGIRAGFCRLEDFTNLPIIGDIVSEVISTYGNIEQKRLIREALRRVIRVMIIDVIDTTNVNIEKFAINTYADIKNAKVTIAAFSPEMTAGHQALKAFLFRQVYRHPQVNRMSYRAKEMVKALFGLFFYNPECLPFEWQEKANLAEPQSLARVVADFIAGMTDRFAISEYQTLIAMK